MGIAEHALVGVQPQHLKECLGIDAAEIKLSLLKTRQECILRFGRKLRETLAALRSDCMLVNRSDRCAVERGRRHARLVALRLLALVPGALHVPAAAASIRDSELMVDKQRHTTAAGTRAESILSLSVAASTKAASSAVKNL